MKFCRLVLIAVMIIFRKIATFEGYMLLKSALKLGSVSVLFCIFSEFGVAAPEIYNCDGVWRNMPCGQAAPSTRNPEELQKKAYLSEKRSLLHGLTMSRLRAKEEYDVDVDIGSARDVCNNSAATLDDCRVEVERLQGVLTERTAALKLAAEKERANRLQEEANQIQQERNEIEANKPNITVIQQYPTYPRRIRRRPYPDSIAHPRLPVLPPDGGVNVDIELR